MPTTPLPNRAKAMDELGFDRTQRQLGRGLERHRTAELGRGRAAPQDA